MNLNNLQSVNDLEEFQSQIALGFIDGIGAIRSRQLIAKLGSAKAVFQTPIKHLIALPYITPTIAKSITDKQALIRAEKELQYALKNDIQILTQKDLRYPQKLLQCNDAPLLLYFKGNTNLNAQKTIAIIGTRNHSDYGKKIVESFLDEIRNEQQFLIISGLAHGIDSIAHKKAVQIKMPTVGVLGHGLDLLYPAAHKDLSLEMIQNGGLLTEFTSETAVEKNNFPLRNRIVAGMSDATIIVESNIKGGAIITAYLANGYNREVFAFPGKITDSKSSGCNQLIKENIAQLITCAADLLKSMNWQEKNAPKIQQVSLQLNFNPEEQKIVELLQKKDQIHADELLLNSELTASKVASTLLQLEMQNIVKALPGKYYKLY